MSNTLSYSDLISDFEEALNRINDFREVPDDLFLLKPDAKSWSASEAFKHIIKFNEIYIQQLEQVAGKNSYPKTEQPNFKPGFISRILIRFMEPPYKTKIPTLSPMYPEESTHESSETTFEELSKSNRSVIQIIEKLRESNADLNKLKGHHPLVRFFPMSVTELVLITGAHQRRHFWQAEQTLYRLSGTRY